MSRFLLDTDHFRLLELGHPPLLKHLRAHPATEIAISAVTVEEALRGRLAVLARAREARSRVEGYGRQVRTVRTLASLNVVGFDDPSEEWFQAILALKPRVGTQDLKIAAVALAHSWIVVTRNRKDFGRIPGILIEDWSGE